MENWKLKVLASELSRIEILYLDHMRIKGLCTSEDDIDWYYSAFMDPYERAMLNEGMWADSEFLHFLSVLTGVPMLIIRGDIIEGRALKDDYQVLSEYHLRVYNNASEEIRLSILN